MMRVFGNNIRITRYLPIIFIGMILSGCGESGVEKAGKITKGPVGIVPTITGQTTLSISEDTAIILEIANFTIDDADNNYPDDFSIILAEGDNYTLDGNNVVPTTNFFGILTVPVVVNDGNNNSAIYNTQISVTAVNDVPVITKQNALSTNKDSQLTINLTDLEVTDVDNTYPDGFTLSILSGTDYTVSGTTITPSLNFSGVLNVPVFVNDGLSNSDTYQLAINVIGTNSLPVITGQSDLSTAEDTPITISLANITVTDSDNSYPTNFTLTVATGNNYTVVGNTITPKMNYVGTLTVPTTVNDGINNSNVFNVVITVTAVNDTPIITGQTTLSINEDTNITITPENLIVNDPDNSYPTEFTLSISNGENYSVSNLTVTPALNYSGTLTVPVQVSDGLALSLAYNLLITVNPINDSPVINTGVISTPENRISAGTVVAVDPDNSVLSYSIVGGSDGTKFLMDSATGEISFKAMPNYETPGDSDKNNDFNIDITVGDGTVVVNRSIIISVTNVLELPEFTSKDNYSVIENTVDIGSLTATDLNGGGNTTFSIAGGMTSLFSIVGANQLVFIKAPDYEAPYTGSAIPNEYDVVVEATNNEGTTQLAITIKVTNDIDQLDNTFGTNGISIHNNNGTNISWDESTTIALLPPDANGESKIVMTGSTYDLSTQVHYMEVWQLNANGTLDTTFGDGKGFFIFQDAAGVIINTFGVDLALLPPDATGASKILVVGHSSDPNNPNIDMMVWRLNADGTLDTTFGGGQGFITHDNAAGGYGKDYGNSLVLMPPDATGGSKIMVTGTSDNSSNGSNMTVWRLNADGSPDKTFGVNGVVSHTSLVGNNLNGNKLTLLPPDTLGFSKILVVGTLRNNTSRMVVWRLNANGSLDTSFGGGNGFFTYRNEVDPISGQPIESMGSDLALLPPDAKGESKIVVSGGTTDEISSFYTAMAVWQLNANGTLDTAFGGGDGVVIYRSQAGVYADELGYSLVLLPPDATGASKIAVTGVSHGSVNTYNDMTVWRLVANGSLDTTFGGGDGIFTFNGAANYDDVGVGLVLMPPDATGVGKLVVMGSVMDGFGPFNYEINVGLLMFY